MNEYVVPNEELKPWERRIRRLVGCLLPGVVVLINDESKDADNKLKLLFLTTMYALMFVGIPALFAIVFTVLAFTVGHPWGGPAAALWMATAVFVPMVYSGYRKDKASRNVPPTGEG